jgi:hypothetical protein
MLFLQADAPPPPAPTFTVVNLEIAQPLVWLLILVAVAVAGYLAAKSVRRNLGWARFVNIVGPFMPPLLWVHGLLFAPSRNYNGMKEGFSAYWFRPRNFASSGLTQNLSYLLVLALLAGFWAIVAAAVVKRLAKLSAGGPVFGFISLILWILAGFALWLIPYYALDSLTYAGNLDDAWNVGLVGLIAAGALSLAAFRLAVFAANFQRHIAEIER